MLKSLKQRGSLASDHQGVIGRENGIGMVHRESQAPVEICKLPRTVGDFRSHQGYCEIPENDLALIWRIIESLYFRFGDECAWGCWAWFAFDNVLNRHDWRFSDLSHCMFSKQL